MADLQRQLAARPAGSLTLDLSGIGRIDTAGAWLLAELARGEGVRLVGAPDKVARLIANVAKAEPEHPERTETPPTLTDRLERLGRQVVEGTKFLGGLTGMLGLVLARFGRALRHPREFRMTALVHHCEEVGLRAVPIVALMAFLIGIVLAFQGASQLRQFGAEVFVVDLISISILRELGILLTAIIVAGRTASSFTAAIGSMKMREEIDAMRTLGLDPAMLLFLPRVLALLIMLPILGLIANLSGLLGGALMSWIELGISPAMFQTRLIEGTDINHAVVGLVKAPFFAILIGVVGCHAGMQVEGNAESLGRMTSGAVVTAIFAVIVTDAAFSIFFAQMGI
ncbi:MlaE family lipid ABC transporter permease subunit [Dinoroseobacter shibae]|nr:MlaE family lipid ABC transporter permease subunit [Dinoroseobacter shibae]URF52869.1 MlaE family lipid ABC transporter permease subunit [Dinoroseobacter shibae]